MRTPQSAKLSETQVDTKLEKPQVVVEMQRRLTKRLVLLN